MEKKIIFILILILFVAAAYLTARHIMTQEPNENDRSLAVEKALDETIPEEDPKDMSPKDRGFGSAHKKRAYEKSKKAHERTDKYFEDNADDLNP